MNPSEAFRHPSNHKQQEKHIHNLPVRKIPGKGSTKAQHHGVEADASSDHVIEGRMLHKVENVNPEEQIQAQMGQHMGR